MSKFFKSAIAAATLASMGLGVPSRADTAVQVQVMHAKNGGICKWFTDGTKFYAVGKDTDDWLAVLAAAAVNGKCSRDNPSSTEV